MPVAPAAGSFWRLPTGTEILIGLGLFAATAVLSLVVTGWILVKLPANYFAGPTPPPWWADRHRLIQLAGRVIKNLLGAALVVLGMALSLPGIPGQGVLTILIGVMFLDIPGKRSLERRIVQWPRVLRTVNALRRRYGKPELTFDEPPAHSGNSGVLK